MAIGRCSQWWDAGPPSRSPSPSQCGLRGVHYLGRERREAGYDHVDATSKLPRRVCIGTRKT
jgi:hypothetical protein